MGNRACSTLPFSDPSQESDTWDYEVLFGCDFWTYAPHTQFILKGFASSGTKGFQTLKMAEMIDPATGQVWKSTIQVDVDAMIQHPKKTLRKVPSSSSNIETKAKFMLSEFPTLKIMTQKLKDSVGTKSHPPWVDIALWITLDKPTNWETDFPMWVMKNNVHNYRTFEDILLAREQTWKSDKDLFFKEIYVSPFDEKTKQTAIEISQAITIWRQLLHNWEHIDAWCAVAGRMWLHINSFDWLHPWHLYRNQTLHPRAPTIVTEFLQRRREQESQANQFQMMDTTVGNDTAKKNRYAPPSTAA